MPEGSRSESATLIGAGPRLHEQALGHGREQAERGQELQQVPLLALDHNQALLARCQRHGVASLWTRAALRRGGYNGREHVGHLSERIAPSFT